MADEATGGTATLEPPASSAPVQGAPVVNATDEDAGTGMVVVPDAPESAAPTSNRLKGETDDAFGRRMFDKLKGVAPADKPAAVRGEDGKFVAKPEGPEGAALEDAAKAKAKPESDAAPATETPAQREAMVAARRALRRDEYTNDEIDAMDPARVLDLGTRRAVAQSRTDAEFKRVGNQPGAETPAKTKAELDAEARAEAETIANVGIPKEILDYLPEADQQSVKGHVATYVAQQTKAAQFEARRARGELIEFMGTTVQREMSERYPALKAKTPPAEFLEAFQRQASHYDIASEAGIRQAMEDAALIAFGKQIKQDIQTQMVERNRAARDNQPDPTTLTAPVKSANLTRAAYDKIVYEELQKGGPREVAQERVNKRIAGRPIVG